VERGVGALAGCSGPFHFTRRGHIVRLNVEVSGSLYHQLLEVSAGREAWDWGEE